MDSSSSPKSLGILQSEQSGSKISLVGIDGTKESKRPWKRSTTRKPTGLASALAASGLAIANTTLSPSHSAQAAAHISPPISNASSSGGKSIGNSARNGSAPGSPPYLSKSPAQSAISQRSSQGKGKKENAGKSGRSETKSPRQGRPRRTSRSAKSDAGASEYSAVGTSTTMNGTASAAASMNGDESFMKPEYYSTLELDADTSSEDLSGSDLSDAEYDYDNRLIPVTGFAVAGTKRNQDFHELFPTVPEGDYLIEGWLLAIYFIDVGKLKNIFCRLWMRTTKGNSHTRKAIHLRESYLFPCKHFWVDNERESFIPISSPLLRRFNCGLLIFTQLSVPVFEMISLEKKMTAFVIPNAILINTRQAKYTFTSFLSRDTTFDVLHNIWRLSRPEDSLSMISGSGRGSIEGPAASVAEEIAELPLVVSAKVPVAKKATICTCGKEGQHYSETALDAVVPGTPEKINNMLFASGFIKDFMSENQKLLGEA